MALLGKASDYDLSAGRVDNLVRVLAFLDLSHEIEHWPVSEVLVVFAAKFETVVHAERPRKFKLNLRLLLELLSVPLGFLLGLDSQLLLECCFFRCSLGVFSFLLLARQLAF